MDFLDDDRYPALLDRASKLGVVAEIFLRLTQESEVVIHHGKVESRRRTERLGMGLRVEREGRVGISSTTEMGSEGLEECLGEALELAALTEPLPAASIPDLATRDLSLANLGGEELLSLDLEHRIEAARAAEAAAFAFDPRVRKSENATWDDRVETTRILNTHGLDRRQRRARLELSVDLVAEEAGEERTAQHHEQYRRPHELDPALVGENAARKALALLGSRTHETQRVPVLLHHEVVAELLDLLSASFSARSILLGTSLLSGKRGEQIAARCIDLVDDPFHPQGVGGIAFDDEGLDAQRTPLVDGGVLRSYLHNSHTARRMGEASTANARRGGFGSELGVGASQLVLKPGTRTPQEIITDISRGFLVSSVMGLHMANPVSGDFSLGIVGHRVQQGELIDPVEGMTIAGNLLSLLMAVEESAADYHSHGDLGCPSLLVGGLTVSGR